MKSLIKPLFLAFTVSLITLSSSFATVKPGDRRPGAAAYKTGIYSTAAGKLNIALDKETGGAVDIRLKSIKGVVLFAQHVGKNETSSRIRLDMSQLQDGLYEVEITNGIETATHKLTLATQPVDQPAGRLVAIK